MTENNKEHGGIPAELPLTGITVVEIGTSVAGPFAGHVLADLGAVVVKVENPDGGDDARRWGPPFWENDAVIFHVLNRNKGSLAVDLKIEAERLGLRRFILERVDVVLQNMRPGLMAQFGLGASLREDKPALIYCNMGAFGTKGPLRNRPGYDPLMQAFAGIMSITGEEARPPVRVGPSLVDVGTAMWTCIGISTALRRREITGEGCEINTSLFETALSWVNTHASGYIASGKLPKPRGSENPSLVPFKAYGASDGYVMISAGNDNLFRRFASAVGRTEWADDPRFSANRLRVENRELLNPLIEEVIVTRTVGEWVEAMEQAGVPCAPLQAMDKVLSHPQTQAMDMFQTPAGGTLPLMSLPLSFDGVRPAIHHPAPAIGADTDRLLGEFIVAEPATSDTEQN